MRVSRYRPWLLVGLLCAATLGSGCLGKMALFNKVQAWNGTLGDKWINSVIHFAFWVVPVYPATMFVDVFVLNTIEFWAGSNPASAGVVVEGDEDRLAVHIPGADGQNYVIRSQRGERADVYRNGTLIGSGEPAEDGSWVFYDLDGQRTRVARLNELGPR
ncbi:MAG: DUF3332 family protein [Myxococcota bacterium]